MLLISLIKTLLLTLFVFLMFELREVYDPKSISFAIGAFILVWGYLFTSNWAETALINYFNPEDENG